MDRVRNATRTRRPEPGPARRTAGVRNAGRQNDRAPRRRSSGDLGTLARVAFEPAAVTLAIAAVLAVVTLMLGNEELSGAAGVIGALWLAVHHVPLPIGGVTLGVLPIAATVALAWFVVRTCSRALPAGASTRDALRIGGAALLGPVTVTVVALAFVADAAPVLSLDSPGVAVALAWTLVVHALAAAIAILRAQWTDLVPRLPWWIAVGVRPALRTAFAFLLVGALATAASLMWHFSTVGELLTSRDGAVGTFGLTALSILYLPNLVVAATAVLTGSAVSIGDVSVSVFGNVGGDLPAFPLLGALPSGPGGGLWPLLLVIPALVGVALGRDVSGRVGLQRGVVLVVASAAGAGLALGVLSMFAGGALGAFGAVTVDSVALVLLVFGWTTVPGVLTVVVVGWWRARRETVPGEAVEPAAAVAPAATTDRADSDEAVDSDESEGGDSEPHDTEPRDTDDGGGENTATADADAPAEADAGAPDAGAPDAGAPDAGNADADGEGDLAREGRERGD